ncbi:hypothetical protein DXG01_011501, partial [Tephrocybe rancida]
MAPLSSSPRPLYFSSGRVALVVDDVVLRLHPDVLSRGSNVLTQLWAQRPDPGRGDTMIRLYNDDTEDIVDLVDAAYMFESFRHAQIRCGMRRDDGTLTILPDVDR